MPASAGEWSFLAACAVLLLGGHLAFGALTGEAAAVLAAGWAALALAGALALSRPDPRRLSSLIAPAIGFAAVMLMATLSLTDILPGTAQPIWGELGLPASASIDRSETLLEMLKLAGLAMAFLVGWGLGERDTTALRMLKVAAYTGGAFAAIAIVMHVTGAGPKTQAGRLEATFLNPNTAGALFGASLCLNVGLALRAFRQAGSGPGRLGFLIAVASSVLCLAALLMTFSRGALAATAAAITAMIFIRAFARRWRRRHVAMGLGGLAAGAILVFAVGGPLVDRFATLGGDAMLRRYMFDSHWRTFSDAPWLGYGLGGFDTINRIRLDAENYAALWNIRSAENVYLQWLVEGGLLTAIPMFATVGLICIQTTSQTLRRRAMLGPLHALLAVDLLLVLHGAVDFALQTYSIALLWSVLLGLQLSWSASSLRRGFGR